MDLPYPSGLEFAIGMARGGSYLELSDDVLVSGSSGVCSINREVSKSGSYSRRFSRRFRRMKSIIQMKIEMTAIPTRVKTPATAPLF